MKTNCETPPSAVATTISEIGVSLKCLSEAIERLTEKTHDIRNSLPYDPIEEPEKPENAESPLVNRLRGIRSELQRRTDYLNTLSDEIQL